MKNLIKSEFTGIISQINTARMLAQVPGATGIYPVKKKEEMALIRRFFFNLTLFLLFHVQFVTPLRRR